MGIRATGRRASAARRTIASRWCTTANAAVIATMLITHPATSVQFRWGIAHVSANAHVFATSTLTKRTAFQARIRGSSPSTMCDGLSVGERRGQ